MCCGIAAYVVMGADRGTVGGVIVGGTSGAGTVGVRVAIETGVLLAIGCTTTTLPPPLSPSSRL